MATICAAQAGPQAPTAEFPVEDNMSLTNNLVVCLFLCAADWGTAARASANEDLTSLSLEQLMNEPVTSVSKRQTRIGDSPAAITVITQEDLRRLGFTTLPEALRIVPGMDVTRIAPSQWAVSARGFNDEFATKLLVLVDGRTVYTPSSAGVSWNSVDVVFEDLDRIEVIRGPGATLWGANAVNGVINIITKSARDTQGVLVSAAVGDDDRVLTTVRYGDQAGADLSWRAFVKYYDRRSFEDTTRSVVQGEWNMVHSGFRLDWTASSADAVTLQGDIYDGDATKRVDLVSLVPPFLTPANAVSADSGVNVLGRWTRNFSADSALTVQTYFDHVQQGDGFGGENRNSYDLDVQHRFLLGWRNQLLWGAGFRYVSIDQATSANITWSPDAFDAEFINLFFQDELTLVPNRLVATVGSKFERNDLSGWFVDPNARLAWTPTATQTLWAAVSRASRTPAEFEVAGTLELSASQPDPSRPPVLFAIVPSSRLRPEQLLTYEIGYRFQPNPQVSVDLSTFYNHYTELIGHHAADPIFVTSPAPPHEIVGLVEDNASHASTFGFEAALQWQPLPFWKLIGSYTFLHADVSTDVVEEHESPYHQVQLRSYLDLPWRFELNTALYYVDSITVPTRPGLERIPPYLRADVGVAWKWKDSLSIGVWGQNLLDSSHLEGGSQSATALFPVPRSWLAKITWKD
jgi:iron complex outermembrane receptor protein